MSGDGRQGHASCSFLVEFSSRDLSGGWIRNLQQVGHCLIQFINWPFSLCPAADVETPSLSRCAPVQSESNSKRYPTFINTYQSLTMRFWLCAWRVVSRYDICLSHLFQERGRHANAQLCIRQYKLYTIWVNANCLLAFTGCRHSEAKLQVFYKWGNDLHLIHNAPRYVCANAGSTIEACCEQHNSLKVYHFTPLMICLRPQDRESKHRCIIQS